MLTICGENGIVKMSMVLLFPWLGLLRSDRRMGKGSWFSSIKKALSPNSKVKEVDIWFEWFKLQFDCVQNI